MPLDRTVESVNELIWEGSASQVNLVNTGLLKPGGYIVEVDNNDNANSLCAYIPYVGDLKRGQIDISTYDWYLHAYAGNSGINHYYVSFWSNQEDSVIVTASRRAYRNATASQEGTAHTSTNILRIYRVL